MKKLFSVLSIAVLILSSCGHEEHDEHAEATFEVTRPIKKDTVILNTYVSQIHAIQHIELRALEKGYLQKVFVDEGQFVKQGQLLFQIQPTIYQAESQRAKAEVEFARVEYENAKALGDRNIVSQNEVAMAKAKLEKAKAELTLAQTHLGFTEVRAPFNGIVGKFENVRLGSLLDEGDLLTTLSDNSKMWVYFNVPEEQYLDYMMAKNDTAKRVQLQLANEKLFDKIGIIETVESDFNNTTGNIAFRAVFDNSDGLLRHGQTGNILWPKRLKNVQMIPQKATFEILEKKFVYVVDKDGTIHSQEVKVDGELNHVYFIKKGLAKSDMFMLEGLRKVRNGDKIKYDFKDPNYVLRNLQLRAE